MLLIFLRFRTGYEIQKIDEPLVTKVEKKNCQINFTIKFENLSDWFQAISIWFLMEPANELFKVSQVFDSEFSTCITTL